jgi:hypothetical protein
MALIPARTGPRAEYQLVNLVLICLRSQVNSVSVATCYRLDDLGIESQWEVRFSTPIQTGPETHTASYTMGTSSFPGVKRPGRDIDHPPPYSAGVKERVELYLCSPSGPSWPVIRWTLPLPYLLLRCLIMIWQAVCWMITVSEGNLLLLYLRLHAFTQRVCPSRLAEISLLLPRFSWVHVHK